MPTLSSPWLVMTSTYSKGFWQFLTVSCRERRNQKCSIFQAHRNSHSAVPGETGNPEVASFSLECCMLLCQQSHKTLKLSPAHSSTTPHFIYKTIDCVYAPNWTKGGSITCYRLYVTVSVAESSLFGVNVTGQYCRDILTSRQMLAAITHVAEDNFVFQQDSAPAHRARNSPAVAAWSSQLSFSWSVAPNSPELKPIERKP